MSRWLLSIILLAAAPAMVQTQAQPRRIPAAEPELRDYVKAHYTKYEYRIPMRDGVKLFTAVYVPKDDVADVSDPADAHALQRRPYGADQYPSDLGPSPLFGKAGYIFVYQDVRGRWMSEGEFVNMRPHNRRQERPQDIDESSDTYDTIDWLVKHVPNHNGKVGHVGHLVSRLLHRGRHDRRPSGPQGRLAAGAGHRLVHRRRLAPQRRALLAARVQLHGRLRPAAARADQEVRPPRSITTRPTATTSS